MNELKIFESTEFGKLGVLDIDGKTYFPATDSAKLLGYKDAINAIKQHCRWVVKHHLPHPQSLNKTIEMNFIPEGDLYRLITNSKLPSAERFERWVFDEVLPAIRKHGMYATPQTVEQMIADPDSMIAVLQSLKAERERRTLLEAQVERSNQIIGELKPKADYVDWILNNPGLVTITQIAKDYGLSGNAMNQTLHQLGVQFKQSNQWLLYRKYHGQGYTHSETVDITRSDGRADVKMNTKWTQKGRLFIYELLKKDGVLPLIEQCAA